MKKETAALSLSIKRLSDLGTSSVKIPNETTLISAQIQELANLFVQSFYPRRPLAVFY